MKSNILIPLSFFLVKYDQSRYPGNIDKPGLRYGANCQYFAFEFLKFFGFKIANFRSSNLWEDQKYSVRVGKPKLFDLVFFNKTKAAYGAHIGVFLGNNKVLHLSKRVGYPTIWDLKDFAKFEDYAVYLGAKRLVNVRKNL